MGNPCFSILCSHLKGMSLKNGKYFISQKGKKWGGERDGDRDRGLGKAVRVEKS